MLIVVLVCILIFLTVIAAIVIVICFVFKKKSKRKIQEHVYDSVSSPPSVFTSLSKSTKLADCESDDAKQKFSDPKVELTDNIAYGSFKPLSTSETTPNAESTTADL